MHYEQCWNGEYKEYYTSGYLVLDMISGMGNAKDGDIPCDSNWVLEHLDKGATDEIFGIWYDYNYGAMAEYVSGRGTVRSVKYALAEKYGFRKDYDTTGNYIVYTNEITELSTLQEEAYLTKYGHYDSYYEEIFGAKRDRYEQLYQYFEDDAKILALTKEEQQFLADFTCVDMGEAGKVATYRDIHTLAEMLKYNMKDSGSGREVIVEGNTIIIRIEGTTDIYTGRDIENHEYRLEFNSEELFGSYYISAGEYANVMGQYSALRIKEGYLGSVQMEELEKQAIRIMESCYTKESLETLSREEYNELLQSCMISADLSGLVYAGYETEHVRAVENFNELKDTFISTFGMVVLAASMMLPPTAPLTIALFGADATLALGDGILRISQGDELEGTIEAFAGALALGEFAYIVKATRGASKVSYSSNIDDVEDFAGGRNQYCLSGEEHYEAYKEMFGAENVEWVSRDTLSTSDRLRIKDWEYPPKDELYIKYKDVYQNELYFNQATGLVKWPSNDGFVLNSIDIETLKEGTRFMRMGESTGEFLGTTIDTFGKRSLAPFSDPILTSTPIKYYELMEDTEFITGDIAPWFGAEGGGKQFVVYKSDGTKYTIQELLDMDILRDITAQVEKGEIIIDTSVK